MALQLVIGQDGCIEAYRIHPALISGLPISLFRSGWYISLVDFWCCFWSSSDYGLPQTLNQKTEPKAVVCLVLN